VHPGNTRHRWHNCWPGAADILKAYPYLEAEDIPQALAYAAWRVEEIEVPLSTAA